MSGGKGGGQTTTAEIPEWAKEPTIRNLQRAEDVQQIGYQPYMGADLAAINPTQMSAMQNTLDASSAFGMSAPATPMQGMPQAQDFGGGIQGYSAYPLFEQAQRELAAQNPVQQRAYDDLFVEPTTNNFDPIMSVAETNFPKVTSPSLQGGGVMDTAPAPAPAPAPTSPVTGLPEQTAGQAYNEKMTNRGIDAVIRANPKYAKPKVKSHRGRVKQSDRDASIKTQREAIKKVLTEDLGKAPVRSDFDNYNANNPRGRSTSNKQKNEAYQRALNDYNKKVELKQEFGLEPLTTGNTTGKNAPAPNKNAPAPKKAAPKKVAPKKVAPKKAASSSRSKARRNAAARKEAQRQRDFYKSRRKAASGDTQKKPVKAKKQAPKTVEEAVSSIVKPETKKLSRIERARRYRGRGGKSKTATLRSRIGRRR